jgi:hypothetical protein
MEAHLRLSRSNQFKGEDGMKRVTGKKNCLRLLCYASGRAYWSFKEESGLDMDEILVYYAMYTRMKRAKRAALL